MDMYVPEGCSKCSQSFDFDFTMAFQPIVNVAKRTIHGYEALVRDRITRTAYDVLKKVNSDNCHSFDQRCRTKAISLANQLGLESMLSINFLPNAVYKPEHCIRNTIRAAEVSGFPLERIMFEVTESEKPYDLEHLKGIFEYYKAKGFVTALDDFGAGYASLSMFSSFVPELIKLDISLVKNIQQDKVKQIVVNSVLDMAKQLNVTVLAEGVETIEEVRYFEQRGVELMQGFFFARPGYESLPDVDFKLLD